jgi:RNA polymerase sigma-70 factor, ECF subfamily
MMSPLQKENYYSKEEKLEQLIIEFEQDIKSLCYSYINDWSTAEDITQEVFIICFEKMDYFRGESSYKTWLAKIAVNKCRDFIRSKINWSWIPLASLTEDLKCQDLSVEEQVILNEKNRMLLRRVSSLSEISREIILLYYFKELKIWEIEKLTGLNQDTIKSRLRRARTQLRKNGSIILY